MRLTLEILSLKEKPKHEWDVIIQLLQKSDCKLEFMIQ